MRVLLRLVPLPLVEVLAGIVGYAVRLLRPAQVARAQGMVRGRYWGAVFGAPALVVGRHVTFDGERVHLGAHVRLHDGVHLVTGVRGFIRIGAHSHVARMTIISGVGGVTIGDNCAIAPHVTIYSSSTDLAAGGALGSAPALRAPVRIGNNCYVGPGARILPGVQIGDNAVVAAGAVVVSDVPDGMIAKGVPARSQPRRSADVGPGDPTSPDR